MFFTTVYIYDIRLIDNKIGAKDLEKVVMVSNNVENKIDSHFSRSELLYQEERRKRKVKRLDFDIISENICLTKAWEK